MKLRKPKKLVISQKTAHVVLTWLYGKPEVEAKDLTDDDLGFSQAMLVKMLDESFEAGSPEELKKDAARMMPAVQKEIGKFLKTGGKSVVACKERDKIKEMASDPVISKSSKKVMERYCGTKWGSREKSGEIKY